MAKRKKDKHIGIFCISGGFFLGWGIGLLFGNPGSGILMGLGLGFLGWTYIDLKK